MTLDPPLALLLGVAGGLLQYLMRQFASIQDRWYHLVAVGFALGLYVLVTPDWLSGDWRAATIRGIVWLAERLPTIWGGSFIVSNGAKAVASRWPGAENGLAIPMTNSK